MTNMYFDVNVWRLRAWLADCANSQLKTKLGSICKNTLYFVVFGFFCKTILKKTQCNSNETCKQINKLKQKQNKTKKYIF